MQMKEFLCGACLELLHEPIIMPCGSNVCQRCHRKRGKSYYYDCPVVECKKKHYYRDVQVNVVLNGILLKLFPREQQSYSILRLGEDKLVSYFNNLCKDDCGDNSGCTDGIKNSDYLQDVLTEYLSPSIELCPYLQLPYIIRSKALAELCRFDEAILDSQRAHNLNTYNRRGLVAEKLVLWRKDMFESRLHLLAKCALSALDESDRYNKPLEETGVAEPVVAAASELLKKVVHIEPSLNTEKLILNVKEIKAQIVDLSTTKPMSFSMALEVNECLDMPHYGLCETDVECSICLRMLSDPVTGPCGHTYCRICLAKALEFSDSCPLCRSSLLNPTHLMKVPADKSINAVLSNAFYIEPVNQSFQIPTKKVPVFICSLIFPFTENGFHMFEPRYRALVKTCLEGAKEFVILMPDGNNSGKEFGTLVRIEHAEPLETFDLVETEKGLLPRFIIQTKSLYRVKVRSMKLTSAGFNEAVVERIDDIEPEDLTGFNPEYLQGLVQECQEFIIKLFSHASPSARLAFERKHGRIPDDPTKFSFWIADVLPLNPHTLYTLLPQCNVTERMEQICSWLRAARQP